MTLHVMAALAEQEAQLIRWVRWSSQCGCVPPGECAAYRGIVMPERYLMAVTPNDAHAVAPGCPADTITLGRPLHRSGQGVFVVPRRSPARWHTERPACPFTAGTYPRSPTTCPNAQVKAVWRSLISCDVTRSDQLA